MCPPGVDQNFRFALDPLRWHIVAPERRQRIDLGGDKYPTRDHTDEKYPFDVFGLLARPVIDTIPAETKQAQNFKYIENDNSHFQRLSTELLVMIMDNLEGDKKDLICLGLSSKYLLEHLVYRVQAQYRQNMAPWANTRVVHQEISDYTMPESFLKEGLVEKYPPRPDGFSPNEMLPAQRLVWAFCLRKNPMTISQESDEWLSVADENLKTAGLPDKTIESLKQDLKCPDFFPKDRTWLLRNLSKQEFVSSDALNVDIKQPALVPKASERQLNFADILLALTYYTSRPRASGWGNNGEEWVGDRFDIVTMESHKKDGNTAAWKDVSQVAVRETVMSFQSLGSRKGRVRLTERAE